MPLGFASIRVIRGRIEINPVGKPAEVVKLILDVVLAHDGDREPGASVAQRLAHGAARDRLDGAILRDGGPMVMAAEQVTDPELAEKRQMAFPPFAGNVEILVGLVSGLEEPRVMLEDDDVRGRARRRASVGRGS